MSHVKSDAEAIKMKIAEIDKAIYDLTSSVKIIGELDQDRNLIISEQESLPEAVKRQGQLKDLMAKKKTLEDQLGYIQESRREKNEN